MNDQTSVLLSVVHCKCLQGFTGTLWGNRSAGISNLWGLHVYTIAVILKSPHSDFHVIIVGISTLQGYSGDTPH